jgi:hypothetical protein
MPTLYQPRGPILDGVEVATGRWACCGMDSRTPHADHCPARRAAAEQRQNVRYWPTAKAYEALGCAVPETLILTASELLAEHGINTDGWR